MGRKAKRGGTGKGIWLTSLLAMPTLTVLFALGTAKLILSGALPEEKMTIYACVYTGLIALAVSLYTAIRMPQKKLLWGMIMALIYLCLLLLGNLLFFGIGYGHILPVAASVAGGGLGGSLIGAMRRKKYA